MTVIFRRGIIVYNMWQNSLNVKNTCKEYEFVSAKNENKNVRQHVYEGLKFNFKDEAKPKVISWGHKGNYMHTNSWKYARI